MKLKVMNLNKTETKSVDLPLQFHEPIRKDIIKRAFLAIQANSRQPYGADPRAGLRASADLSRRRRKYRGSYGMGISRVPRKILSRRGTRMNWVGAVMPGTVGGRRAHPPKAEKIWSQKVNKKENRKAIRSAIAATIDSELLKERNHQAPSNYPFIISDEIIKITQTKKLIETLEKLGFKEEIERSKEKGSTGLLIVTTAKESNKGLSNIKGFDTENVANLNVRLLAPGGVPGRMTLFTESAIKELADKKLFTQDYKGKTQEKVNEVKKEVKPKPKPKLKSKKETKVAKTKKTATVKKDKK